MTKSGGRVLSPGTPAISTSGDAPALSFLIFVNQRTPGSPYLGFARASQCSWFLSRSPLNSLKFVIGEVRPSAVSW